MLIEFSVGNYRSFKDPVTLSMVAANITSKDKRIDENNVFKVGENLELLTSAAIYGANGSGKSNLIEALSFMRTFVLDSSKETQSEEAIAVDRFRLSTETDALSSFFQVVFLVEGTKYRYGFEVNTQKVTSEWLFYVPKSKEAKLFDRSNGNISFTSAFKEARKIPEKTRDNALFLSVVAQFNGTIAQKILSAFRNIRINQGVHDMEHIVTVLNFHDVKNKDDIFNLMKRFDLNIDDFNLEKRKIKASSPSGFMSLFKDEFVKQAEGHEVTTINTMHRKYNEEGRHISTEVFNLSESESEGTKRLLTLAGPILDGLKVGRVVIIDELDARLHPLVTCAIIKMFNNKETNPYNAQLIFTTHDTNLLNNKILRRDQVWFAEKDKQGVTHLFSLVEFKVRNDAAFERDYIHGKYGAIPFIGDLQSVFGEKDD